MVPFCDEMLGTQRSVRRCLAPAVLCISLYSVTTVFLLRASSPRRIRLVKAGRRRRHVGGRCGGEEVARLKDAKSRSRNVIISERRPTNIINVDVRYRRRVICNANCGRRGAARDRCPPPPDECSPEHATEHTDCETQRCLRIRRNGTARYRSAAQRRRPFFQPLQRELRPLRPANQRVQILT